MAVESHLRAIEQRDSATTVFDDDRGSLLQDRDALAISTCEDGFGFDRIG